MKTFTVSIDERLDRALDELKASMGKTSRAEVFRLAVTLLKIADEARQEGLKLAIADKQGKVQREILIPGCDLVTQRPLLLDGTVHRQELRRARAC